MILHICGGPLQLPAIKWTKELGLKVALTDLDENCPGREYAEAFAAISADDSFSIQGFAAKLPESLKGIYAGNDLGIRAVTYLGWHGDFPSCSVKARELAMDKKAAKEAWRKCGVTTPRTPHGLPFVVKPSMGSGSCGVSVVRDIEELSVAMEKAYRFPGTALSEEYISGLHIDANCCFIDGKFIPCGIAARGAHSEPPNTYPIWGYAPAPLTEGQEWEAYELLRQGSEALGITCGPVKGDMILSEVPLLGEVFYLLEITPRFHGEVVSAFLWDKWTGDSPVKMWIEYLATRTARQPILKGKGFCGWKANFKEGAQDNRGIEGFEYARAENLEELKRELGV